MTDNPTFDDKPGEDDGREPRGGVGERGNTRRCRSRDRSRTPQRPSRSRRYSTSRSPIRRSPSFFWDVAPPGYEHMTPKEYKKLKAAGKIPESKSEAAVTGTSVTRRRLRKSSTNRAWTYPGKRNPSGSIINTVVPDPSHEILVSGFPIYLSEDEVKDLLLSYGEVQAFNLVKDEAAGMSERYAFVQYADFRITDHVIARLNSLQVDNQILFAKRCTNSKKEAIRSLVNDLRVKDYFPVEATKFEQAPIPYNKMVHFDCGVTAIKPTLISMASSSRTVSIESSTDASDAITTNIILPHGVETSSSHSQDNQIQDPNISSSSDDCYEHLLDDDDTVSVKMEKIVAKADNRKKTNEKNYQVNIILIDTELTKKKAEIDAEAKRQIEQINREFDDEKIVIDQRRKTNEKNYQANIILIDTELTKKKAEIDAEAKRQIEKINREFDDEKIVIDKRLELRILKLRRRNNLDTVKAPTLPPSSSSCP